METVAVFDFMIGLDDKKSPLYLANYYKIVFYERGLSIFPAFFGREHIGSIVSTVEALAGMTDDFTVAWGESKSPRDVLRKMKSVGYVKKFREFVFDGNFWNPKNGDASWETRI